MSNPDWTLIGVTILAFGVGYWAVSWLFNHLPKATPPPAGEPTAPETDPARPSEPHEQPEPPREEGRPDQTDKNNSLHLEEIRHGTVLGLKGEVTPAKIKQAYRELLTKYHPDKVGHLGPEFHTLAEQRTKEIIAAYEYFRKKYDLD